MADLTELHDAVRRWYPGMAALEVGHGAYEAIRTAWPAEPPPFGYPPPSLLPVIGAPVRIVDDLGRDGWRVIDEDGVVVASGDVGAAG